jgi:hypothetical protein
MRLSGRARETFCSALNNKELRITLASRHARVRIRTILKAETALACADAPPTALNDGRREEPRRAALSEMARWSALRPELVWGLLAGLTPASIRRPQSIVVTQIPT